MANPLPRPALRKAPDANVHPAYPSATVAGTVNENDHSIDLRGRDQANTSEAEASKAGRLEVVTEESKSSTIQAEHVAEAERQPKRKQSKKERKKSSKKKARREAKQAKKIKRESSNESPKLAKSPQSGKSGTKRKAEVSPDVRRKLRSSAKARGTDLDGAVDAVVADLRKSPRS